MISGAGCLTHIGIHSKRGNARHAWIVDDEFALARIHLGLRALPHPMLGLISLERIVGL
jgi:hypothetical protein